MSPAGVDRREPVPWPSLAALAGPHLALRLDQPRRALWAVFTMRPAPYFNRALLDGALAVQRALAASGAALLFDGDVLELDYMIIASEVPGVFNLGGDLGLFASLIERGDRPALHAYARDCAETVFLHRQGYGASVCTLSLVQGRALGGGFECALSSDTLVAERSALFGFPEMKYSLFPGMGAFNLLARRIPAFEADALVVGGELHGAARLQAIGAVATVCRDGEGVDSINRLIDRWRGTRRGFRMVKALHDGLAMRELEASIGAWVDAAMRLTPAQLGLIRKISKYQAEPQDFPAATGT